MSDPQDARVDADREAAEWHVRLGERPVSAETLTGFRAWRALPDNAAAYQRLEALWRATGSLSSDADIQSLTRDTLRVSRPRAVRPGRKVLLPVAALATVVAMVAIGTFVLWPSRDLYTTAVGEQEVVRLADGSEIRLDTDTRLQVRFDRSERDILLERGQALFVVAHDADRPFRVSSGDTVVTALGTTFDVRRDPVGTRVTLVTGAVAVTDATTAVARSWRLAPGQQVRTAMRDAAPVAIDTTLATSWSEGRLVFRGTPLQEAVAEVNRYLPQKIVLDAGPAAAVPVNGVFKAGDREAFVAAATDLFGLEARDQADGGVRLAMVSPGAK